MWIKMPFYTSKQLASKTSDPNSLWIVIHFSTGINIYHADIQNNAACG